MQQEINILKRKTNIAQKTIHLAKINKIDESLE